MESNQIKFPCLMQVQAKDIDGLDINNEDHWMYVYTVEGQLKCTDDNIKADLIQTKEQYESNQAYFDSLGYQVRPWIFWS